ncbi:MAG: AbrB/MazE/SpoVT family DNA-binding domain-containing protein [Selenomonadales bacterium]|jgi:AbrB family looped-hinge helix DNA binding protein|nr:AbrB/MazE/SpoVT family DNA-binding domain-containing protein [Selenomonadales bacterium]
MHAATISAKYQIVIPREIRKQFALKPGQKVVFIPYKHTLRVVAVPPIEEAYGFIAGIDTSVERDEQDRV